MGIISVDISKCIIKENCRCKIWCPDGAIKWRKSGHAWIDSDICFSCGECCRMINRKSPRCYAIQPENHSSRICQWKEYNNPFVILIGPGVEHYSSLQDLDLNRICGALKLLGAKAVFRSRLGVQRSIDSITEYVTKNLSKLGVLIDSRCGAIRNYIRRHSALKPYLVKADSTLFASAKVVRELLSREYNGLKVIFLGPDIAYKEVIQMEENVGLVDAVLTWVEFEHLCTQYGISLSNVKPEELDDPAGLPAGEIPRTPSLSEVLELLGIKVRRITGGISLVLDHLNRLNPQQMEECFIEVLACGDCSQGPGLYEEFKDRHRRIVTLPDPRNPRPNDTFEGGKATYVFGRHLGSGAAGKVYEVWVYAPLNAKPPSGKLALKIYEEWLFHREPEKQKERIKREIEVAKSLDHPNILKIFWDDTLQVRGKENVRILLMEFVEGKTLDEHIKEQSLDQDAICNIMMQLCHAVEVLHKARACHRNVKPSNIILKDGHVKLLDFGVVFFPPSSCPTRFVGTRDYAAPEWLNGDVLTDDVEGWKLIDIYGIGCVLFDLLMGEKDTLRNNVYTTREKRNRRLEELKLKQSLSPLEKLMLDMLANTSARIQNISEVNKILDNILKKVNI